MNMLLPGPYILGHVIRTGEGRGFDVLDPSGLRPLWVENGRLAHAPEKIKMVRLKGTECGPILAEVSSGSGYVMSLLPDILQVLL